MGPVWDFNIAFGIGDYCDGQYWQGWAKDFNEVCGEDAWVIHFWWERLWNEPAFRQRIAERWLEHRSGVWSNARMLGVIDSLQNYLAEAQVRNFQRWPVFSEYVWPNFFIGDNYEEEIQYLQNWLTLRLAWLDQNIPLLVPTHEPAMPTALKVYPNPTNGHFQVDLPNRPGQKWTINLYDASGQQVWQASKQPTAARMGIALPEALPGGLYFCQMTAQDGQQLHGKLFLLP
jgi:hypothetical protein